MRRTCIGCAVEQALLRAQKPANICHACQRGCTVCARNWCAVRTHLHDDLPVGDHHGDTAEERLEVLRQLLAPSVARVHGDEESHTRVQRHIAAIREDERFFALTDRAENAVDL